MPSQPDKRTIVRKIKDRFYPSPDIIPSQAEQFIDFMDKSVLEALRNDQALADSEEMNPFFDAVRAAAVNLKGKSNDQMSQRMRTRRTLLWGGAALAVGGGIWKSNEWLSTPYTDPFVDKDRNLEEKRAFEQGYTLLGEEVGPSYWGYKISHPKFDSAVKWQAVSTPSKIFATYKKGEAININQQNLTGNLDFWMNEYKSSTGEILPVLEIVTEIGNEPRILNGKQTVDPSLDTSVVKFKNIYGNRSTLYFSFNRVALAAGSLFEVRAVTPIVTKP